LVGVHEPRAVVFRVEHGVAIGVVDHPGDIGLRGRELERARGDRENEQPHLSTIHRR
jgi:hypothetical protein